jgi:hypothetical protein
MTSITPEQAMLLKTYNSIQDTYRSCKQLTAKLHSSIVYNSKCVVRKVLPPNLEIHLSSYTWPKGLEKSLTDNSDTIEQLIFRQALTDIFLHRNTILKKTYANTIEFINKHTTDQLLSQMFIHKQPTLVDYATTLSDMVERFRSDNPLSTQILSPTATIVQPTEHERMKDPYATMEVDESDQFTQLDPDAPPISSSSASTNSIQRNIAFEYSTSPVVSPPTSDFDERFKSLETKLAKLLTFTGALKSGKAPASPTTRHASPAKKKKRDIRLTYFSMYHSLCTSRDIAAGPVIDLSQVQLLVQVLELHLPQVLEVQVQVCLLPQVLLPQEVQLQIFLLPQVCVLP